MAQETDAQRLLRERGGGAAPAGDGTTALAIARPGRIEHVPAKNALEAYERMQEFQQRNDCIVLMPTDVSQAISPFYATAITVIEFDLSEAGGDVYGFPTAKFKVDFLKPNERALAKNAILKIGDGGGITWDVDRTCRMDDRSRPEYCEYRAVGGIRRSDGSVHWIPKTRVTDLETIRKGRTKVDENGQVSEGKIAGPEYTFLVPSTETKALLGVVRALFKVRQKYTVEELQKKFVIPRVVFSPDIQDPQVRAWMQIAGQSATRSIYGPMAGMPALPAAPDVAEAEEQIRKMQGASATQSQQTYDAQRDRMEPEGDKRDDIEDADATVTEDLPEIKATPDPDPPKAEVKTEVKPAEPVQAKAETPATPAGPTDEQVGLQQKWLVAIQEAPDRAALTKLGTAANMDRPKLNAVLWQAIIDLYGERERAFIKAAQG